MTAIRTAHTPGFQSPQRRETTLYQDWACRPVSGRLAAWSGAPDAASADALSTAFMIMAPEEIERYCTLHPDTRAMVIMNEQDENKPKGKVVRFGKWKDVTSSTRPA